MLDCSQRLADVLKKYREELHLTQEQVAEKSHLDPRSIINMEMGRGNPQLKTLNLLIQALHIDARELFDETPSAESVSVRQLRSLVNNCTDEEAATLYPVVQAVLTAIRAKRTIPID